MNSEHGIYHIDDSISCALAMEVLQFCTKPSIYITNRILCQQQIVHTSQKLHKIWYCDFIVSSSENGEVTHLKERHKHD